MWAKTEVFSVNASPDGHIWTGYHNGVIQVLNASYQSIGYLSPSGQIVPQQVNFAETGIFAIHFDIKGKNMDRNLRKWCLSDR